MSPIELRYVVEEDEVVAFEAKGSRIRRTLRETGASAH